MRSFLFISFALLLPLVGRAGDNSCLERVRLQRTDQRPIPATIAIAMGLTSADLRIQKPLREFFRATGEFQQRSSLEYSFELRTEQHNLFVAYLFLPGGDSSDHLFSIKSEWRLSDHLGTPVRVEKMETAFTSDCQERTVSTRTSTYEPLDEDRMEVEETKYHVINAPTTTKKVRWLAPLRTESGMNLVSCNEYPRLEGFQRGSGRASIYDENNSLIEIRLRTTSSRKLMNPFSLTPERARGLEVELGETGAKMVCHASADGRYQVQSIKIGTFAAATETLPRALWLRLKLKGEVFQNIQVSGFRKEDFLKPSLRLQVRGLPAEQIFNRAAYFRLASEDKKTLVAGDVSRPQALPWDNKPAPGDQRELRGSQFIQIDKVTPIVDEVRPLLKGKDRIEAARIIIEAVNRRVKFDTEAVNSGLIDRRNTEDILETGRGVCQHYAVVFTAVARALGIPSRIVYGLRLQENQFVGHAWVEVKANAKTWWPLEPQTASETLPERGYIPIGQMRVYEPESTSPAEMLKVMVEFKNSAERFSGVQFIKHENK